MLATVALMSCSESDNAPVPVHNGVEITLRPATINASVRHTRAPFEGAIGMSNPLEARVIASLGSSFSGTAHANGTMIFKGAAATVYETSGLAGSSQFPNANPVYLFGMYPKDWNYTGSGAANYTFTGKEDAMATEKISTQQQDVTDGVYKALSFRHLLTRLEVKLSAADAVTPALGSVTSVKLIGNAAGTAPVSNNVNITNSGAALTTAFSSGGATSLNFYGLNVADNKKIYTDTPVSAYTLTTVPTFVGYSMVAPVNATAANVEEYFLEITTSGGGVKRIAVDLTSATGIPFEGNTAGRVFIVSIYFKSGQEIAINVEVAEWIDEGEWHSGVGVN